MLETDQLAPEMIAMITAHLYFINKEILWHLEDDDVIDEEEGFDEVCLAREPGNIHSYTVWHGKFCAQTSQ